MSRDDADGQTMGFRSHEDALQYDRDAALSRQPEAQSAPGAGAVLTSDQVIDLLLFEVISDSGARMLRNGEQISFSLNELTLFANHVRSAAPIAAQEPVAWRWKWKDASTPFMPCHYFHDWNLVEVKPTIHPNNLDSIDLDALGVIGVATQVMPSELPPLPDELEAFGDWCVSQGWVEKPIQRGNGKFINGTLQARWLAWQARAALATPRQAPQADAHTDDIAVDRTAAAVKAKLAKKRGDGRGGWDKEDECSIELLAQLLIEHIAKGDPVDINALSMMLHQREAMAVEHHPCHMGSAARAIKAAYAQANAPTLSAAGDLWRKLEPFMGKDVPDKEVVMLDELKTVLTSTPADTQPPQQGVAVDARKEGEWIVRERRCLETGELIDCFVEAPREGDMAYGLQVLGDDYTGFGDIERKYEHCNLITSLVNAHFSAPVPAPDALKTREISEGFFAGCKIILNPNLPDDTVEMRSGNHTVRLYLKTGQTVSGYSSDAVPDAPDRDAVLESANFLLYRAKNAINLSDPVRWSGLTLDIDRFTAAVKTQISQPSAAPDPKQMPSWCLACHGNKFLDNPKRPCPICKATGISPATAAPASTLGQQVAKARSAPDNKEEL